jgi:chromosome segregation ATPase
MARDLKLQVVLAAIDKATGPIKSIMQGSAGLARTLKSTRDTLKGLQAQQSNISSFKALKGATEQTGAAMQANREKLKQLSRQMASTATPTKALSAEFQRAVRQGQALKQKHGEQQRELQGLRGKLNAAGISTRNLGQHERDLRQKITQTNQSLSQQEARLKRVTQQQQRLAKAKQQY